MTVAAIETKLADVELVAVRDGLNGTVAHVRVPRGKEVPDARDRERRTDAARDGGHDRELVPPGREDLGQRLGLRGAGGQLPRPRVRDGTVMPHPRSPTKNSPEGTTEILPIEAAILPTNSGKGQARAGTRAGSRQPVAFRSGRARRRRGRALGRADRLVHSAHGAPCAVHTCGCSNSRRRAPRRSRSRRHARWSSGPPPAT